MLDFRIESWPDPASRRPHIEGKNAALYPLFMDLAGWRCVVVGGGKVARRKARKLLEAGADVAVISPEITHEIEALPIEMLRRGYAEGDLAGAFLAFAATDVREVNAAVVREARERGVPVNVADEPSEGDFALPSTLRRGGLQVAVSTGGASPALARSIRQELEGVFVPEWAEVVGELERTRGNGETPGAELEGEVRDCLSRLSG